MVIDITPRLPCKADRELARIWTARILEVLAWDTRFNPLP